MPLPHITNTPAHRVVCNPNEKQKPPPLDPGTRPEARVLFKILKLIFRLFYSYYPPLLSPKLLD